MNSHLYIIWKDSNNMGIPIIDEQHRGIVTTINSLHYFIQNGHGDEIIAPTLNILLEYTKIHFNAEEKLITEADYPALEKHKELHKKLVEKTKIIAVEVDIKNDPTMVLDFLKDWWLNHINVEDRKYVPYLEA